MKIGSFEKNTVWLVLAGMIITTVVVTTTTVIIPATSRHRAAEEKVQFDKIDREWLNKALSAGPEQPDPRPSEEIGLYTASSGYYEGEILSTSHYENTGGAGWRIDGGIVDLVKKGDTTYALYAKQVGRYEFGGWNNVLDPNRSFGSVVLIKYEGGQAEVLDYHRLGPHYAQVFVGLRLTESGVVELLRHSSNTADDAEVMSVYR